MIFQSCEKFLDEEPKYEYSYDQAVTNYKNAISVVNGLYSYLQENYLGPNYYPNFASQGGFSDFYSSLLYGTNTPDAYNMKNTWKTFYKAINAANIAIYALENLADEKYPSVEVKNELIAEARMLRAWWYTHLMWSFTRWWDDDDSKYGLLYREGISTIDGEQLARITVGESYEKIFADIDFAIENLPVFTDQFHVSQLLAKALKAKIYLYRGKAGDYQAALTLVDDVINTAPGSIHMEDEMGIFPETFDYSGTTYNETSFDQNKSRMGALYANSWDSPENIFVRYLENDGRRSGKSSGYAYYLITASSSSTLDASLTSIALGMMDEEFNKYRKEVFLGWSLYPSSSPYYQRPRYVVEKLSRKSRYVDDAQKWAVYFLRYSELLLMQAELRLRTNPSDITNGLAPLNLMRQNRGEVMVGGVVERFLPDVDPTALTYQEAMDILFKEYFLELGFENGSEWFATLRFETNGHLWINELNPNIDENRYCWAIPADETRANMLCEQNPGYTD